MLPKAHSTSYSRMSGYRWVIIPLWLSGLLRSFLYSSSVCSCHLFLMSSVVLEKTCESPLDSKEIKPVNSEGNQSWIFIGRTDAEAETPILWPPDAKSWLIGEDPDAGKDWRQEEKGTREDEMVGWHHQHNGHEFEQVPGAGNGQGSLACCSPWGHKESDTTERLNWTELNSLHQLRDISQTFFPCVLKNAASLGTHCNTDFSDGEKAEQNRQANKSIKWVLELSGGFTFMNEISALVKEASENSVTPSTRWGDRKSAISDSEPDPSGTLILNCSASRRERNKFMWIISHPGSGILLSYPKQTKICHK